VKYTKYEPKLSHLHDRLDKLKILRFVALSFKGLQSTVSLVRYITNVRFTRILFREILQIYVDYFNGIVNLQYHLPIFLIHCVNVVIFLSDLSLITLVKVPFDNGIIPIFLACSLNSYGQTKLFPIQSNIIMFVIGVQLI
jgi:hypothetical protein